MLACVDVDYSGEGGAARAAVVAFASWDAPDAIEQHVVEISDIAPYESGAFYKRELPCILAALSALTQRPQVVIVDGYIWLGPERPGLGARLFEADRRIATVVGVAKTAFVGAPATSVLRGQSASPLWVDEIGEPVGAPQRIAEMHGSFRVPTMLRRVDQLARGRL